LTIHRVVSTGVEELDSVLGGGFPKGSLIVLAGSPGTGKTVFSARFLYHGAVNCGEKGIYVSLCEGKEIFMENMRGFGFDFEKLERGGMFRFLDMLTVKEKGISTILDMIIGEVEKFGAERLVLDSFSAMAHAFKDPIEARIIVHTILGKLIRGMGCTILLIKETGGNDVGKVFEAEEFVADGVIRFLATELEDQRLRSLEIIKLRGARLKEPRHVFTLDGGFKVFEPFEVKPPSESREPFQPPPDRSGKYSMGSKDMDEFVGGGMPESSFMILECDEKVPITAIPILLHTMTASFMLRGRGVVIAPSSGVSYASLSNYLGLYGVTHEHCEQSLRVITLGKTEEKTENCEYETALSGEDWKKDLETILKKHEEFASKVSRPILLMVCAATLATLYGEKEGLEILKTVVAHAKNAGAILIAIIGAGYRDLAIKLSLLADFYLRLTRKHGCLILYGVKPKTGLYGVECDVSKGYPLPKLTPIL